MKNRITERVVFALPLVFVALCCCVFVFGCGGSAQQEPLHPELECRAKLLEPYVTAVASDLLDAASKGGALPAALVKSLHELNLSVEQVSNLVKAWERCAPDAAPAS